MKNFPIAFPNIIGHRGACGHAPENTLASMRKAHELGIGWVEFDVMLTADEEAILMHDITLDRTTNGHGEIANTRLAQIVSLDAGSWFAPQFAGERVPTFKAMLDCAIQLNLQMNIEIKPTPGKAIITAQKVVALLQQHWPTSFPAPLISSAELAALDTVYQLNPNMPLGFITDEWRADWQTVLSEHHCVSLHIFHGALDDIKIQHVKQVGYGLLSYTVNDTVLAEKLWRAGVDRVFTDFPERINVPSKN